MPKAEISHSDRKHLATPRPMETLEHTHTSMKSKTSVGCVTTHRDYFSALQGLCPSCRVIAVLLILETLAV